jgi:hypothetical protein
MVHEFNKDKVLWVEDRPDSVDDLIGYCRDDLNLTVYVRTIPYSLNKILKKHKNELLFIAVDLLLYGVNDLYDFGLPEVKTGGGYRAGWEIVDKVLRPEKEEGPYTKIPVAIITTRQRDPDDETRLKTIQERARIFGHGEVLFMEKAGADEKDHDQWKSKFTDFVKKAIKDSSKKEPGK